jgi:phosphoserine phosphatase RsbU/P
MKDQLLDDSEITPVPLARTAAGGGTRQLTKVVKTIRVLLIDDNDNDADLIGRYLELSPEHLRFDVERANCLADGQKLLAKRPFDVAVVNLSLPDSHGLATFQRLRDRSPDTPVVVITGEGDEELAAQAVQQGAEDYLVKDAASPNVLIRSLRYASERSRRRQAERALKLSHAKMLAARKIQQKLFPAKPPVLPQATLSGRRVSFDVGGASFPAEAIGGDYFDCIPMVKGTLGLAIGDVSGHGFAPALLMVETRAYLRALSQTFDDVSAILAMTNRVLRADISDDQFVTLLFGRLDAQTGSFAYCSAGHSRGYILAADGEVRHVLDSMTLPLGVAADSAFPPSRSFQLEPGDALLLLTDGIVEARSPDNEPFGAERVLAVARHYRTSASRNIVQNLYHAVRAFTQVEQQMDDITALVLKVEDLGAETGPNAMLDTHID